MLLLMFVYGTLKSGEPNYNLMKDEACGVCIPRGIAYTKEKYPLVVASRYNVPYLLYKPGTGHNVQGELYEVEDAQLERLDRLESHPKLYVRKDVVLTANNNNSGLGEDIAAQAYFLVNFRPHLLELPMLGEYKDMIDEKKYSKHKDRDVQAPLWWYEISTDYEKELALAPRDHVYVRLQHDATVYFLIELMMWAFQNATHLSDVKKVQEERLSADIKQKDAKISGLPNHHLIENKTAGLCIPRGTASSAEKFPLVVATRYNIPFMLYAPGKGNNIQGELYEVDETRLESLDKLEAHPHLYERRHIAVTESAGHTITVQTYFLVKYRPLLLDLPMLTNYEGQGFISPKERKDMMHWWFEVHTGYEDAEKIE